MSKNTEIKLVGQPILKQVLNLVDSVVFKRLGYKMWPRFKAFVVPVTTL